MVPLITQSTRWGTGVQVRSGTTRRAEGDFAIDGDPEVLATTRRGAVDLPWVWLHQVHGAEVHVVGAGDAAAIAGRDGDALVTAEVGLVLAVQTADCVPVTFSSAEGVIGAAHAGWRGIDAGVLGATVNAMRRLGATAIEAQVGPCIHAGCYEFGADELDRLVDDIGPEVEGRTTSGARAFDAVAAVDLLLEREDVRTRPSAVDLSAEPGSAATADPALCTACHPADWYSHRARADTGRMATVIWRDR